MGESPFEDERLYGTSAFLVSLRRMGTIMIIIMAEEEEEQRPSDDAPSSKFQFTPVSGKQVFSPSSSSSSSSSSYARTSPYLAATSCLGLEAKVRKKAMDLFFTGEISSISSC